MIPGMFGAQEIVLGNDYTCERLMSTVEDGVQLQPSRIQPGSVADQWLKLQRFYLEETEGNIPVHVCDMQGPLDAAGQIWGYENLLAAPYEEEIYDRIMSLVTEAFITLWKEQQKNAGDLLIPTHMFGWDWVPEGNGVSVSTDSLAMISPQFYKDYYRPYLERISCELGPMTIHSCGQFGHQIRELYQTTGLAAINAGQMTIAQLLDAGIDSQKIIIWDIAPEIICLIHSHQLKTAITFRGIWPETTPDNWTDKDRALILERVAMAENMCRR